MTDATVTALKITDTNVKEDSAAVTQVVKSNTANLTIFVKQIAWRTKIQLSPDEVLEIANLLLVTRVPNR